MSPDPPGQGPPEELLQQSEERYRLLVESVKDYAIFMLDPDGYVVTWNEGAQRIKGYAAEEALGRHFSAFYLPEDVAAGLPQRLIEAAARDGRAEDETWRVRKDGSRFWADVVLTALRDPAGKLRGFAKVTRDLTERRRNEEQARQLAREQVARAAAEEQVRARDQFLSIASHELRTPLNPLQLQIQMLLRLARAGALAAQPPDRLVGMLETCERSAREFAALVSQLLDLSRLVAGGLDLRLEEVDLAALAREVAARYGPELDQAGCELRLAADRPAVGRWDRPRLDQVLTNLLSNATKYGPGKPVEVSVAAGEGRAVLTVRDHGIGIAPADQARIFDRFERAVSGYEYGGLGLGLYVVRQIVEALGGTVRVDSAPGAGATFVVELSQSGPPAASPGAPEATSAPPAGRP
jgi:PAS domain S-box-containing protein